jgi:predicted nucleic acid-binding protein
MDSEASMIALDTNLLVYAHREGAAEHDRATAAILRALNDPQGWGICLPSVAEFWSVVTNPANPGGPSSSAAVTNFFHRLVTEGHGRIWTPGPGFGERLMRWAASLKLRGTRIFDLQIAVIALEHGARELWTHDSNFVSVPGLKVLDPIRIESGTID